MAYTPSDYEKTSHAKSIDAKKNLSDMEKKSAPRKHGPGPAPSPNSDYMRP